MARYFLKTEFQTIKSFTAKSDEQAKHIAQRNYVDGVRLVKAMLINGVLKEKAITLNIN